MENPTQAGWYAVWDESFVASGGRPDVVFFYPAVGWEERPTTIRQRREYELWSGPLPITAPTPADPVPPRRPPAAPNELPIGAMTAARLARLQTFAVTPILPELAKQDAIIQFTGEDYARLCEREWAVRAGLANLLAYVRELQVCSQQPAAVPVVLANHECVNRRTQERLSSHAATPEESAKAELVDHLFKAGIRDAREGRTIGCSGSPDYVRGYEEGLQENARTQLHLRGTPGTRERRD